MELSKTYNPAEYEQEIYKQWEASGFFNPDKARPKPHTPASPAGGLSPKPFCIIMPPPNANGSLHIGHAVFVTLEDLMIRYHRMKGEPTLWLPGADHAGFETQVVYQKKLEKEGRNWFQIPREELYQEIMNFTLANKSVMENQLRRLGASCDWSREIFTLDERIVKIVYQTFKKMHDDGLLYRGERIVHWCVKHQTTLSDLEVKHEEREGKLTYIKYPLNKLQIINYKLQINSKSQNSNLKSKIKNLKSDYIVVATTRPETMLGDTAVAVNPKDKRYKHLVGQTVILPLVGREIPIIADAGVEMAFGTGAVKVTPAHDPLDFEIAERHGLAKIQVIGQDGKMNDKTPEKYRGLKSEEARAQVVEDLRALGLLEKEEPYKNAVGVCYKCNRTVEPLVLPQWFVKMKPLAEKAMKAAKKGEVKFVTKRFEKIFFHWLKNIRDWNISRQIVWGIRMPVWYCEKSQIPNPKSQINPKSKIQNPKFECPPIITDGAAPEKCPHCGGTELKQESDVFDTWFSSGQWPFAALLASRGNPKSEIRNPKNRMEFASEDFEKFYPTSVMETGHDILFFWVARMIMMGLYATGKVPFKYVYLHGLVRDKDRQKMSKSKGNVVDPLGVVDLYGADALRMALVFGVSAGNDIVISEDKIRAHRNFANKIWNASRFVLMNLGDNSAFCHSEPSEAICPADKAILKKLSETTKKITRYLDKFEFHLAAETIYHFFWHEFCDKYLEEAKGRLQPPPAPPFQGGEKRNSPLERGRQEGVDKDKQIALSVLYKVLLDSLKLLHPFMPFVTEAVYQMMPEKEKEFLMIEEWPHDSK